MRSAESPSCPKGQHTKLIVAVSYLLDACISQLRAAQPAVGMCMQSMCAKHVYKKYIEYGNGN